VLSSTIEIGVRVEVKFIITSEGTRAAVGSGTEINRTSRTEVTSIVTSDMAAMSSNTVVETKGGAVSSVSLVDFREAIGTRRHDVGMRAVRRNGSRNWREVRARSDVRTSSRGVTVTLLVTPFPTVVAHAMEGGPKGCGRMGCLWMRLRRARGSGIGGTRGRSRGWGVHG